MSLASSNYHADPHNPQDPLYYAPRSVRGQADPRILQTRSEELPPAFLSQFDEPSENAFVKSIAPLKPPFEEEHRPLRLRATAGGIAAAIGVAAIIALFFYNVFPKSNRAPAESAVAISTPASAAPAQVGSDDSQALLQGFKQFQKLHGSENSQPPSAAPAKEEPEKPTALLEKFIQWEQRN